MTKPEITEQELLIASQVIQKTGSLMDGIDEVFKLLHPEDDFSEFDEHDMLYVEVERHYYYSTMMLIQDLSLLLYRHTGYSISDFNCVMKYEGGQSVVASQFSRLALELHNE